MATPVRPAATPPPPPPPPPPPQPLHHDTTLTLALALALPPRPFVCARPRPRPPDGVASSSSSSSALARVRSSSSSPAGDSPPPPCTECGRRFPSWKALFGHMRCHPERQWRGITPPPHFRHQAAADQSTVQDREIATSLLMLAAGARSGAAKGKKSTLGASSSAKGSCSASTSSPAAPAPPPPRCDGHKCSVCARGFATGQALGGHKRCHWERAFAAAEGMAVATPSGCVASTTSASEAAATTLDLNLPPPGMPFQQKADQDGSLDATLDLKLGY